MVPNDLPWLEGMVTPCGALRLRRLEKWMMAVQQI